MPVDNHHLKFCINEAERFLVKAKAAVRDASKEVHKDVMCPEHGLDAAVRRSSMDLTRALAQLRKTY